MTHDKKSECELPFWKDFSVLFNDFSLEFKPNCQHSAWNFAARLILISVFIGLLASVLGGLPALAVTLMFGTFTALAIIFTTKIETSDEPENPVVKKWDTYHKLPYIANVDPSGYLAPTAGMEGFVNGGSKPGSVQPFTTHNPSGVVEVDAFPYSGPMLPDYTPPTARNLFMNVLLDEIKYNPGRPEAAPVNNPTVKQTLDDYFRVQ